MKNDLKILAATLEKKFGKAHIEHDKKGEHDEFVKHDEHMGKMNPDEHHKAKALHKVWDILKGKEKRLSRRSTAWHCLPASRAGQIFRAHCMAPTMGW